MSFNNIIGHKNIISFLEQSFRNGKIAHAYLFYGPNHLGKKTVAESFAEMLLGRSITNHPDVYIYKREFSEKNAKLAKNISIEQMRDLERKLSLSSFLNSYKIGIIEEAESLSSEAANSLLKTLEEPTPKTVIILLSSRFGSLPETIVSRCQLLKFLPVSREEIYEHLVKMGATRDTALNLVNLSWGKPGLAINYWQSQAEQESSSALGAHQEKVQDIINLMASRNFVERMKIINSWFAGENNLEELVKSLNQIFLLWSSVLRDLILMKNGCRELIFNSFAFNELEKMIVWLDDNVLLKLYREIKLAERYLRDNLNPSLVLENLLLTF